mmetsp:Transcript_20089/g.39017  ORF Transcript_20089/g.39017 Transcript_20089/m.39017 type:complete len:299 (-) Transcript_20089:84-980(-)|eukprot:CAMPEP_0173415360 /NCGR_PEP_ID=MMETSP1356-20130122/84814_1 /TAXON_ID=77927 ORGANISM="Hemiselmis virescens, Strain PCC157" /NCGR_SAMPLE_ID=MMETSP1356 /ASSEMBLY_ACC=CAM_ASM_000847 /LENGTH=298 /DNA_ID=CAMNT_0014377601 /DNA_START=32 /DNA_END=928 /DNA_ORIENTATION=+
MARGSGTRLASLLLVCWAGISYSLVVPIPAAKPAVSLDGVSLPRVSDGEKVNLGPALASSKGKTMLVLGSYPGDFNTVEYAQKVRAYWPQLQEKGVNRCMMVINGEPSACTKLAELLDLPSEMELFSDPTGEAGRKFGVSRGFRPDDASLPPSLKLFAMGIGIGPPWMTLPAVLQGYFGNPGGRREWIEAALKQGQEAGRWPSVLELGDDGSIKSNKFDDTPLLSGWGQRPFELATLRLQNLASLQLKHRDELKHVDDRCLTQLGGCTVVGDGGEAIYSWVDQGLCDVPDMYDIVQAI